jgi:hypothetical protein
MDSLGGSHPWVGSMNQANDYDHNSSRSTANYPQHSGPATSHAGQLAPHHQQGQTIIQVCGDVKPRLTKEQHDILERHFQQQSKPTTSTKKSFADALGVPLDKINVILICSPYIVQPLIQAQNWFQNRRAKVKQDLKKQLNAYAMYQATIAQHSQQYLPPPQPLPSSAPQEFFDPNTALPSTEYSPDSASSDGGCSSNFPSHGDYSSAMPTIIQSGQPGSGDGLITNLQTTGFSMQNMSAAPGPDGIMSIGPPPYAQNFDNHAYSLAPDLSSFDAFSHLNGLPDTLAYPPYLQTSAPPVQAMSSSMPSLSDSQTATPLSTAASPNTMPSLTSAYSHPSWMEDRKDSASAPADSPQDSVDSSNSIHQPLQPSSGPSDVISWPSAQMIDPFKEPEFSVIPAQGQAEPKAQEFEAGDLPNVAYARRNSSTAALAESMNTVDINCAPGTESGLMQAPPSSGLAARRQKARPANLGLAALRSASYSAGMPVSPGSTQNLTAPEQSLRRIRSGGVAANGRISKPLTSSGQRSPMNFSFAEAAASPKFARHASTTYSVSSPAVSSPAVSATAGSLAPPTPSTPGDFARFPSWQSHGVVKTYPSNNNNHNAVSESWSGAPVSNNFNVNVSSPPDTPLDGDQLAQYRSHLQARTQAMFRDTPPQSAPATQQSFPSTTMLPQSHDMLNTFSNYGEKSSHIRRPSLPEQGLGFESQQQWPIMPMFSASGDLQPMQFNPHHQEQYSQLTRNMQNYNPNIQESFVKSDFSFHQYSPPQVSGSSLPPRNDSPPKAYHFSNHGPRDFEATTASKS